MTRTFRDRTALLLLVLVPACGGGSDGTDGPQGEQGAQGDPGARGEMGEPGPSGSVGVPGPEGAPGAQGPEGEQGAQGIPGTPGMELRVESFTGEEGGCLYGGVKITTQQDVHYVCSAPRCGNGVVEPGEECDDAALLDDDGCSARCEIEDAWSCTDVPDEPSTCEPRYTIETVDEEDIVTDKATDLVWQRHPAGEPVGSPAWPSLSQPDALDSCDALDFAGFSDWRLPAPAELQSLVVPDQTPSSPTIDRDAFPGTPGEAFWTSQTSAVAGTILDFNNGVLFAGAAVPSPNLVRCVRSG